jgi:2-hydroxy-4-carboxymuconate semialdehyde hemiacetal dehydrogenase
MTIRVALIGCGAVGSIHAANLRRDGVELTAVYSPSAQEASSFASIHGIRSVSQSLAEAIANVDVAIICSPSDLHFEQARTCVEAGVHTLVELPPCAKAAEADELGEGARKRGVQLGCAHTARYLHPYASLKRALQKGVIGEVLEVNYVRYHQLRARSWTDNALLHHAAHPIDLLMDWFGGLEPVACMAVPHASAAQSASILGKLPNGGPVAITVSYASRLPLNRMLLVGKKHTVETDGFSYVRSDLADLELHGTENHVYEQAIRDQDAAFLGACLGNGSFVDWADTVNLMRIVNRFQALCEERSV